MLSSQDGCGGLHECAFRQICRLLPGQHRQAGGIGPRPRRSAPGRHELPRWRSLEAGRGAYRGRERQAQCPPELQKALAACRRNKAKLCIAKLDRLSRNLAFSATLMDSGVEFVATDNPHANKLTIHILAAVAEHEREAISERTKAALAAAKARGKKLGGPRLAAARRASIKARSDAADAFAANVRPIIKEIQASGVSSLRGVARALTARGVPTARGGSWSDVQVAAVLRR